MKYASVVSRFAQVLAVLALPVACAAGPTEEELGASEGELNQAGPLCPDARCGSGTQCCLDTTNKKLTCSASCAPKNKIQCRSPRDCDGTCCADVDLSVGFLFLSVSVNSASSQCVPQGTCADKLTRTKSVLIACDTDADCAQTQDENRTCCPIPDLPTRMCVGPMTKRALGCTGVPAH